MVRGSERAFRELVRENGVHVAFMPMVTAAFLLGNELSQNIIDCDGEDSPRVAQIAGRDPEEILKAAKLLEGRVDAIDVNLGCPQDNACRKRFGAFLLEEPQLVEAIVETLCSRLSVPIFCKIRVLETEELTIAFAKTLEKAGCSLLSIHGRTLEQKGRGSVNYEIIETVARTIGIPVVANGGFTSKNQADEFLFTSECAGVMFASALLENHCLLAPVALKPTPMSLAMEYLRFAEKFQAEMLNVQLHMRWIFRASLSGNIRIWSVFSRPWMDSPWKFVCFLASLDSSLLIGNRPDVEAIAADRPILRNFKELRRGRQIDENEAAKIAVASSETRKKRRKTS